MIHITPMRKRNQKVFVMMSGGVDSSVAAALLQRDGFRVIGVYMKCWEPEFTPACTSTDDERSARLAAAHLGIPFYSWNFVEEYRMRVGEYMFDGYRKGITPNPDVMCNREIKFGLFFEKAMRLGADFVATGHYARVRRMSFNEQVPVQLLAGADKDKDQSYFLSLIRPTVLDRVLFPIGEYTKREVRELARRFRLPNAERKSSQGICFVGKVKFRDFLSRYLPSVPGNILDTKGKVVGTHRGLAYYTIGQRQGIGLPGGPWYVAGKDIATNTLLVTNDEKDLEAREIVLKDINWFLPPSEKKISGQARIRYRQPLGNATLEMEDEKSWKIRFEIPQRAATPGQIAAFYQGDILYGGGIIEKALPSSMLHTPFLEKVAV